MCKNGPGISPNRQTLYIYSGDLAVQVRSAHSQQGRPSGWISTPQSTFQLPTKVRLWGTYRGTHRGYRGLIRGYSTTLVRGSFEYTYHCHC